MGRQLSKILFSAQRNEGPFLLEWVAYHRAIGFDRIVIYSNDCTDGSDDLLDALADLGVVEHHRHTPPTGTAPQIAARDLFLNSTPPQDGDWVLWLDSDEFLLPMVGEHTLDDLIGAMNANAVAIPWRLMGDGGNTTWPGRHINAHFTGASAANRSDGIECKTLFKVGPQVRTFGIHRPAFHGFEDKKTYRYIYANGDPVRRVFFSPKSDGMNPTKTLDDAKNIYGLAQVLHFKVRTPDLFSLKAQRGDGFHSAENAPARDNRHYRINNRNDEREVTHLVHEAATVELMTDWLGHEAVKTAAHAITNFRMMDFDPALKPKPLTLLDTLLDALAPEDKVRICDIGANPLDNEADYAGFLTHKVGRVIGFEPQEDALAKLNDRKSADETYLPNAVGTGEDMTLYVYKSSGYASKFAPDPDSRATLARLHTAMQIRGTFDMPTTRLDDIADVPPIDVLKIDVQGSELDIIANGRAKLADAVVIQTEVRFFPIYENEPEYAELHSELVAQGFRLHCFLNTNTIMTRASETHRMRPNASNQLLDGDAIYYRDIRTADSWTDRQLQVGALFALLSHPSPDLVTFFMCKLLERGRIDQSVFDSHLQSLPRRK